VTHAIPGPVVRSALAVGTATLLLVGCGSSPSGSVALDSSAPSTAAAAAVAAPSAAKLSRTLVFSPLSRTPLSMYAFAETVRGYAKTQGWDVVVQDPKFDAGSQVQQLDTVIGAGKAGAGWVLPLSPTALRPIIAKARAKGLPLLISGRPQDFGFDGPQPGIVFDAVDFTAEGTAWGSQMGKCISSKMGGRAKIIVAQDPPGLAGAKDVTTAMTDALKVSAPNATVVATVVAKDRDQAGDAIATALQAHPEADAFLAANDEGLLGGVKSFAAAGKTLACSVNIGGDGEVLRLVKEGLVSATIALQYDQDVKQAVAALAKMQADPTAKGPVLTVPVSVVVPAG
jgi:ABC-type sugar transport system substrate-binding protein